VPIIKSQFSPSWLFRNTHVQTVLASKLFKPEKFETVRERIEMPDGDFVDIEQPTGSSQHVVALFHGLAGCVESPYIQGALATLSARGFHPILMHWRGSSGESNRLARAYHSGASDDIQWFIDFLAARFPSANLYAIGYSLGGNALLKYLGEQGSASPLTGAMSVSPPLVLAEGATKLNAGVARIYQWYLLDRLRMQHEIKRLLYPNLNLPVASRSLNTFWKFDDALTAPLHGYAGVNDYYNRCSARQFLPCITTPTHILSARDDPFFTPAILPDEHELSSSTVLEIADHGGHVGFLKNGKRWLDEHVANKMECFKRDAS
jgi:predicted alpha/beta-fold hydrolase